MSTTNTAAPAAPIDEKILSSLITNNDLSKLSPDQKVAYYSNFCERLGLDPLSKPFEILRLNGKEILYCGRAGVQQLSMLHNVSHKITARDNSGGCYLVSAQASKPDGRCTESIGAVSVEALKGESLANAMMKAESKAKRRATLDLLGLGALDSNEGDALPAGAAEAVQQPAEKAKPAAQPVQEPKEETPPPDPKKAPAVKEEKAPPAEQPTSDAPDSKEIAGKLEAYKTTITGFVGLDEVNDFLVNLREQPAALREAIKEHFAGKVEELNGAYNPTAKIYVDKGLPAGEPEQHDEKWFQERIGKLVYMHHNDPTKFKGGWKIEDQNHATGAFKAFQNEQGFLFADWVPTPAKKA